MSKDDPKELHKDAFLRDEIMAARDADAERIREEMSHESESERQTRLYIESNRAKFG